MADEKKTSDPETQVDPNAALNARLDLLEAQNAALADELATQKNAAGEPASQAVKKGQKRKPIPLTGETFKYKGKEYKARFPFFVLDKKTYSEADLVGDAKLQAKVIDGGYRVVDEV